MGTVREVPVHVDSGEWKNIKFERPLDTKYVGGSLETGSVFRNHVLIDGNAKGASDTDSTKSVSMDWKTFSIVGLVLLISMFVIGYNMQDTGLQDGINEINAKKFDIRQKTVMMESMQKSIDQNNERIIQVKEELKTKYSVIFQ